jgi:hypothetical protein
MSCGSLVSEQKSVQKVGCVRIKTKLFVTNDRAPKKNVSQLYVGIRTFPRDVRNRNDFNMSQQQERQ